MKLVYQYMAIFFNFSPTLYYLRPLQVENCDINLRLVVDRDDNGKVRLKWVDYSISTKIVAIKMYNVDVDNLIMPWLRLSSSYLFFSTCKEDGTLYVALNLEEQFNITQRIVEKVSYKMWCLWYTSVFHGLNLKHLNNLVDSEIFCIVMLVWLFLMTHYLVHPLRILQISPLCWAIFFVLSKY